MNGDRFLTHDEFLQEYNANINFLDFTSVISAIKRHMSQKVLPSAINKTFFLPTSSKFYYEYHKRCLSNISLHA